MYTIDINLSEIHSQFVNVLKENDECIDVEILNFDHVLNDFNERIINPNNINDIISLCDYLLIIHSILL
jgi:hypothetical protein